MSKPRYAAILITQGAKVLIGLRAFGQVDPNGTNFATTVGGGKVEPDEEPLEAAVREAREETFNLVEIDKTKLVGPFCHSGKMYDSFFWIYKLPDDVLLNLEAMRGLYETYNAMANAATTPEDRKHYRLFTEFKDFAWENQAAFSDSPTLRETTWPLFPPTFAALQCVKWN